jgi:hypothetical protein
MATMPAKTKTKTQPAKASSGLGKAAKTAKPAQKPAAKAAVKAAPTVKREPATTKKTATATEKAPKLKSTVTATEIVITTDDIALRAYYIAERRRSMGWSGDEHSDWVEAESQLKAEAKRKRLRE